MAEIAIPSIGVAMTEALLVKWLKEPGDEVAAAEPVVEIETDKATMDLESPVAGRLGPHLAEPGAIVPVGTVIVQVVAEGEAAGSPAATVAAPPAREPAASSAPSASTAVPAPGTAEARTPHAKSPRARRLEQERSAAAPEAGRFRELIAAKVAESWREIPHFAVTREVDAEPMLAALAEIRAAGGKPASTLTDLLLRALALALRRSGAGERDVGLAVATPHGVVIPVIRDVLALDATALAAARSEAVERARAGRLSPGDLEATPPTTLSNLGAFGIDHFTGIIALGQTSLLTVGRAVPRVVADGDRTLSVRTTFHATLNVDHRSVDGAEAAHLLVAFVEAAEGIDGAFLGTGA
jgi:pyruvate/2-oxoglutarate dehydrogenase complex dihydrolipoamide acyltransferase (E2) component